MNIPRLHPDTIEAVKEQIDILDIVADYVVLRRRGKNHLGLCPFHEEKTPSFTVNPAKQLYHCFGCGAGGNAFSFLMELEKRSFSEVVLELAQKYQIPIQTLEPQAKQELEKQLSTKEQLYSILAVAANFYQHALFQPQGEAALTYLEKQRKLEKSTIQSFQLGYAPGGWETIYRYLVDVKRYPVGLVEDAGLIRQRQSGGGYYDRFRDRLMIPICDQLGRVIAFGSRTLTNEEPKYLNSPETLLFDKSKTLFALDKAYRSIAKQDKVIIVEGYFDAIALHAVGIDNVVACLGTALTQAHLKKILRYTESKEVILNFDADTAGNQATERIIGEIAPLVYSKQVQLKILHLPEGKDADEFLQTTANSADTYRKLLTTAPLWLDWQLSQLLEDTDLKQAGQFQQVASKMVGLLAQIPNFDLQSHYISYCSELLSQGNPQLIRLYAEKLQSQLKKPITGKNPPLLNLKESSKLAEAESTLLRIYLYHPEYRELIYEQLDEKDLVFVINEHRNLWIKMAELAKKEPKNTDLMENIHDIYLKQTQIPTEINKLLTVDEKILWEDKYRAPLVIKAAIASLEEVKLESIRRHCLAKWQRLNPLSQAQEMADLSRKLEDTEIKLRAIAKLRLIENEG